MSQQLRYPSTLMHAGFSNAQPVSFPEIQKHLIGARLERIGDEMRERINQIILCGVRKEFFRPRDNDSITSCLDNYYVLISRALGLPLGGFSMQPDIDEDGNPSKEIGCFWSAYANAGIARRMMQLLHADRELSQQPLYALTSEPTRIFTDHGFRNLGGIDEMAHMPTYPVLPNRIRHYPQNARHPKVHMNLFQKVQKETEEV